MLTPLPSPPPSRIIAVPVHANAAGLAPEAASLTLDAAPLRLALSPDGRAAAVALAGGAVARVDLTPADADALTMRSGSRSVSTDGSGDGSAGAGNKKKKEGSPSLSPGAAGRAAVGLAAAAVGVIPRVLFRARASRSGAGDGSVAGGGAEVKALAFSADGAALAAGGDDGVVRLYSWPALTPAGEITVGGGGVRDVDWAGDDCVAVAHDDGTASVWSIPTRARLAALAPPADLPGRASIARVRFDRRAGVRRLLAAVNAGGRGWVVAAEADAATPPAYAWRARAPLLPAPVTAFDVSPCGRLVGAGSADGDVWIADARSFARRGGAKRAHMVFVTAVAFQRCTPPAAPGTDGPVPALLSVSADASARVTRPTAAARVSAGAVGALLAAVLLLVLLVLAAATQGQPACRRVTRSSLASTLGPCLTAAGRAAAADARGAPGAVAGAAWELAVAMGVVGRFPGGDRGEL